MSQAFAVTKAVTSGVAMVAGIASHASAQDMNGFYAGLNLASPSGTFFEIMWKFFCLGALWGYAAASPPSYSLDHFDAKEALPGRGCWHDQALTGTYRCPLTIRKHLPAGLGVEVFSVFHVIAFSGVGLPLGCFAVGFFSVDCFFVNCFFAIP